MKYADASKPVFMGNVAGAIYMYMCMIILRDIHFPTKPKKCMIKKINVCDEIGKMVVTVKYSLNLANKNM